MSTTYSRRATIIKDAIDQLQAAGAEHRAAIRTLEQHPDYSDSAKARHTAERRAADETAYRERARRAWQLAAEQLTSLDAELKRTVATAPPVNWPARQGQRAELEQRIAAAAGDGVLRPDTRVDVIARELERVALTKDVDRLWALQLAARPALLELTHSGTPYAGQLLTQLEQPIGAPDRIDELMQERAGLEQLQAQLRRAVLELESTVTNQTPSRLFPTISDWQSDIFGDDYENTGAIVWRTPAQAIVTTGDESE